MGVLADKDYMHMLNKVTPLAKEFVCITPPNPRALDAADLSEIISKEYKLKASPKNSLEEAVEYVLANTTDKDIIVAFGSLYYVGLIKNIFIDRLKK